jgi:acetyl-CoA C-acetyltransferase
MSERPVSVIVAGARTPLGRMLGSLKGFSGTELGAVAIKGALDKAGVRGDQVQYVIMGQVLTAGAGQIPARQAAVKAGIPMNVPALSINKVCLSGIDAIALADQLIRAGEFEIIVAGGQESMSNAPHLLEKSRDGFKYGDVTMHDHMDRDGLWDSFTDQGMGLLTEQGNAGDVQFTRAEQDEFAARSHQLAARAWKDGLFDDEVVAMSIPQRKGDPIEFKADESIRADTTAQSLAKLRPAFSKDGTITAGSASPISDGAAAVVVMSKAKAEELGLPRLAPMAWSPAQTRHCRVSRPRPSRGPVRRRASAPPISTWSRSTRHSPRWGWHRPSYLGSTRTRSTSTEALSPSGTPSACRGPGSPCTSSWSSDAVAAVSVWPPSAVVAGRETH